MGFPSISVCYVTLLSLLCCWSSLGQPQGQWQPTVHGPDFSPDYVLQVRDGNITIDCQSRYSVFINGSAPAPTLYMKEGQTTWVRVYNDMSNQNTTVHWHGLSQRTAPFSDGTPQVSQWPIGPAEYFDYEIRPEVGDAGTYFYHSHVDFQAITAHGPIIVEDCRQPPYTYDEDLIIFLQDYYNETDASIVSGLLANPFVWSGETYALLVNGQSGTSGFNNATDTSCAPYVVDVKPGTTYRLRFIGGTAISLVTLGIEGHSNLTIIEADGTYSKPYTTDHLQVASGQRFSLLFTTKSEAELQADGRTSYWIQYENRDRPANVSGFAILSYGASQSSLPQSLPTTAPLTLPQEINSWLEYSLEPLDTSTDPFPSLSEVTRTVIITAQQILNGSLSPTGAFEGTLEWEQNGDVWQTSRVYTPYLVSIYLNGEAAIPDYDAAVANGGWDPQTLAFPAKMGEVLDIVWQNDNGPTGGWDIHPFHAHGGHYWDLGSGNGTYDAEANEQKLAGYSPMKRDTTMLYRYASSGVPLTTAGWRAWRIRIDDAGAWMMHCHILQHMIMGMQTVWVMGNATEIVGAWPEPYVTGYLSYGGSAYGNASYDPLVAEYFHGYSSESCQTGY